MATSRIDAILRMVFLLAGAALAAAPCTAAQPAPATTRKVVLAKVDKGYRWQLLSSAPVPKVGDHQVLVHVRAVALNRGDLEILASNPPHDLSGLQVGSDAAGDILTVGRSVTDFRPGMRVTSTYFKNWVDGPPSEKKLSAALGASVDGVLADYVVLDDTAVAPAPAGLNYDEAATLPTAGLTAWMATIGRRPIHAADVVLVQGTGGVSTFALQFAVAAGARVILTSSSDDKLRRAKAMGASDGINYQRTPEWSHAVLDLTHGHGADIVVDVGGKATLLQSVRSLAYGGTLSIVGGLTGYDGEIPAVALLGKTARAQGVFVGSRADLLRMNAFIGAHHLHPVIDRVFPLEQFGIALKYMEAGNFIGKVVLRVGTTG
jgi:NADPH:quinone reductase-like Zn-dependent oxidoreductase